MPPPPTIASTTNATRMSTGSTPRYRPMPPHTPAMTRSVRVRRRSLVLPGASATRPPYGPPDVASSRAVRRWPGPDRLPRAPPSADGSGRKTSPELRPGLEEREQVPMLPRHVREQHPAVHLERDVVLSRHPLSGVVVEEAGGEPRVMGPHVESLPEPSVIDLDDGKLPALCVRGEEHLRLDHDRRDVALESHQGAREPSVAVVSRGVLEVEQLYVLGAPAPPQNVIDPPAFRSTAQQF